ncbi:MAG: Gfo/Idh/MocA family oxidoreductase [Chlorobi bacterium]|nr:Gfo/Idh/MocA family oxidoreductase [Chlorobiota bacterium]
MASKSKLRFCVIGCGNISLKYSINALIESENSEVVVCVDHGQSKKKVIEERFRLPFGTSFGRALKDYDFDAVYIATPTASHKEFALEAAENKKHILCEKSLAANFVDAEEMVFAAQNNGVALFEGFMYQFHRQNIYIRNLLKKNVVGEVFLINAWFGFPKRPNTDFRLIKHKGGGGLLDAGAYTVHLARNVFGSEPIKINAGMQVRKEIDISGSITLNFTHHRSAHLYYSMDSFYKNKYELWGEKGNIRVERAFSVAPDHEPEIIVETAKGIEKIILKPDNHFIKEIDYFCENHLRLSVREQWYKEAAAQAMTLENIVQRNNAAG